MMAKQKVKINYMIVRGIENDKARHEAGTAVSAAELKAAGFPIAHYEKRGIIRLLEDGDNGNG